MHLLTLAFTALTLLSPSTTAISTNASNAIFPLTWQVTSLNGQQLLANSTGSPNYSYVAFAFTDTVYRKVIQCSRKLSTGDYKTLIADGIYYSCEDANLKFALNGSLASLSGYALGLEYTFNDAKGVFTTDCGTVHATSLEGYYELNGISTGTFSVGKVFTEGQAFVPFAYNETVKGTAGKCKVKRFGGPY